MPQLGFETGLGDQAACLPQIILGHEDPAGKGARHALQGAHMRVGDENWDIGVFQEGL